MKISFFCIKFPIASETFVLKQIISFIEMGHDVNIISLYQGDMDKVHDDYYKYGIDERVDFIFASEGKKGKYNKIHTLCKRVSSSIKCILKGNFSPFNILKYRSFATNLFLPSLVGKIDKKFSSDVIVAHFGPSGVLANYLRSCGCLQGKIATVFHGYDLSAKELLNKYHGSYQDLFLEGELFLPISNLWKNKLIELGCSPGKISVIRMGIKIEDFTFLERNFSESQLKIVSVCRLIEKKGISYAINACRQLKDAGINFCYKIVGYGDLIDELQSEINKYELDDVVKIVGFQPQEVVRDILLDSHIFLLPSVTAVNGDMEGIPVALMEAMATGLPVISTYHSGIPELITNSKTGWLCPERDSASIAKALYEVIRTKEIIPDIIHNARLQIEENFNQDVEYKKMACLLEDL
ncbi:TPA: glycosyltransferase [Raoultella planticola]